MKLLKQIVLILIILIAVGCLASLAFLSEAQRMIVLVGGGFAILNLVFILFFISKNSTRLEPRREQRPRNSSSD